MSRCAGALSTLEMRGRRREYDGIHAVYLMVLLRLSDYLQIQASRAPAIVFKYRHIPSPQSQLEWEVHNSITNITQTHNDPESLEIQCKPATVMTYLRIKEWLSGLQDLGGHPKAANEGQLKTGQ